MPPASVGSHTSRGGMEDKIERLSCSLSHGCWCSGSCWSSGSCRHLDSHQRRPQNASCQAKIPEVESHQGEPTRRWDQSPSPVLLRWQVTFEDSHREDVRAEEPPLLTWGAEERTGEPSDWSRPEPRTEEEDLKCPPALDPHIQEFLAGGEAPWAGNRMKEDPQQTSVPEPSSQRTAE